MINFRALLTERRPDIKLILAAVAVGWGLGQLTAEAAERQDAVGELNEQIQESRKVLSQLNELLVAGEGTYRRLQEDVVRLEDVRDQLKREITGLRQDVPELADQTSDPAPAAAQPRAVEIDYAELARP